MRSRRLLGSGRWSRAAPKRGGFHVARCIRDACSACWSACVLRRGRVGVHDQAKRTTGPGRQASARLALGRDRRSSCRAGRHREARIVRLLRPTRRPGDAAQTLAGRRLIRRGPVKSAVAYGCDVLLPASRCQHAGCAHWAAFAAIRACGGSCLRVGIPRRSKSAPGVPRASQTVGHTNDRSHTRRRSESSARVRRPSSCGTSGDRTRSTTCAAVHFA